MKRKKTTPNCFSRLTSLLILEMRKKIAHAVMIFIAVLVYASVVNNQNVT